VAETSQLRRFIVDLGLFAQSPHSHAPLYDGSRGSLGAWGFAYLAAPRVRPAQPRWFPLSGTFRDTLTSATSIDVEGQEFFLAVHWWRLLSKAGFFTKGSETTPGQLRKLAHRAWWALIPLVDQHDAVLADILRRASAAYDSNPKRVLNEPFWCGIETETDQRRFDAQMSYLLSFRQSDKQPAKGFCDFAAEVMRTALDPFVNVLEERHFGFCTVTKHNRSGPCEKCPLASVDRPHVSVFDLPLLMKGFRRGEGMKLPLPADHRTVATEPSITTLRWITDTRFTKDGVYRFELPTGAAARMVNFTLLRERLGEIKLETILDDIPPGQLEAGTLAKAKFTAFVGSSVETDDIALGLRFEEARWGDHNTGSNIAACAVYRDSDLYKHMVTLDRAFLALAKARQTKKPKQTRRHVRRAVTRTFTPTSANGRPVDIGIVRSTTTGKQIKNFFTTPYDVDPTYRDPNWRRGRGLNDHGVYYWTLSALNFFANLLTPSGEPLYPEGVEFREWANGQDGELANRKAFVKALYQDHYTQRIVAVDQGLQHHLGPFTAHEDDVIRAFFCEGPKRPRLSPPEWAELLTKLPHRSVRGVLHRFDELGKQYAMENGYQAYSQSRYCRKFSAPRCAQWKKEGCLHDHGNRRLRHFD